MDRIIAVVSYQLSAISYQLSAISYQGVPPGGSIVNPLSRMGGGAESSFGWGKLKADG
jgi:hypothetical protein